MAQLLKKISGGWENAGETIPDLSDYATKQWVENKGYLTSHQSLANYVTLTASQIISGTKTFTGGISVSGRSAGGGDDEGIVVGRASNDYAGVCLGNPSGIRSVFYLLPNNDAVWRYNNGTSSFDLQHPKKAGTIATTSDLSSYVPTTRTINNKALSSNITLNASDVGAATKSDVPTAQAYVSIVANATTNLNGYSTGYSATDTTLNGYTVKIIKSGSSKLTQSQATSYMQIMTGSSYLPQYNQTRPCNTLFIFGSDNSIWKPQYDSTNGLVLYYVNTLVMKSSISYSNGSLTLTV